MHVRRVIAAGTGAALLLAGSTAVTEAASQPDLTRFYTQQVDWSPCEAKEDASEEETEAAEGMECGKLTVPVDYADPGEDTLELALSRFRTEASGTDRKGSVVFNFGGPGISGIDTLPGFRQEAAGIAEYYDLVSFDPRGVGRSSPVKCGGQEQREELPQDGSGKQPGAAEIVAATEKLAEACRKDTGPLLDHVGTINVSRDMDVLRQALGDKKLNYMGISYGTRLGAVYASQFPKKTGRMALDAVDTLQFTGKQRALMQTKSYQQALDAFFAGCAEQGCGLGSSPQAVQASYDAAVKKLTERPLKTADGQDVTAQDLQKAAQGALLSQKSWPALAQGVKDILDADDPGTLMAINKRTGDRIGSEAILAINCADDPERPADPVREYEDADKQLTKVSPYFGPGSAALAVACAGWPKGTDYLRRIDKPGAPKILMIGSKNDPATPYAWAQDTAKRLGSGVLITYEGEGHGAYLPSQCIRTKVDAFFVKGTVPDDGTTCPAEPPAQR
ncbi:alpha/beta hydrolase [Streptomyces sp. NPDC002851]